MRYSHLLEKHHPRRAGEQFALNAQIAVNTRTTSGGTGQAVLNLTANTQFPSTATFNGITLRFQALTPSPQANTTIARSSYVASFTATTP